MRLWLAAQPGTVRQVQQSGFGDGVRRYGLHCRRRAALGEQTREWESSLSLGTLLLGRSQVQRVSMVTRWGVFGPTAVTRDPALPASGGCGGGSGVGLPTPGRRWCGTRFRPSLVAAERRGFWLDVVTRAVGCGTDVGTREGTQLA